MNIRIVLLASLIVVGITNVYGKNSLTQDTVLHADLPFYPALAVEGRLSGTVHLHVAVEDGTVSKVESDSPPKLRVLINAASENVKTWRFAHGVRGEFDVSYRFELRENEGVLSSNPHIEMDLPMSVNLMARPVGPICQDCGPGSFHSKPNKR
jgi:hypothetical protein